MCTRMMFWPAYRSVMGFHSAGSGAVAGVDASVRCHA